MFGDLAQEELKLEKAQKFAAKARRWWGGAGGVIVGWGGGGGSWVVGGGGGEICSAPEFEYDQKVSRQMLGMWTDQSPGRWEWRFLPVSSFLGSSVQDLAPVPSKGLNF